MFCSQFLKPGGANYISILQGDKLKSLELSIQAAENQELEVIIASNIFESTLESLYKIYITNGYYTGFKYSRFYIEYENVTTIENLLRSHTVRIVHSFLECLEYIVNENKTIADTGASFVYLLRRNAQQKPGGHGSKIHSEGLANLSQMRSKKINN